MMRIIAVVLLSALMFAPMVHSQLVHEHGTGHDHGETSIVWASLHQAATHEDKALIILLIIIFLIHITHISVLCIQRSTAFYVRQLHGPTSLLLDEFLTRGLLPSRKFK